MRKGTANSCFTLQYGSVKVGIIAAYQKTMAEKMASTEEERGVDNRKEVKEEVVTEEMEKELEEAESLDNLPVFERQSKGRATVCLGDMKPRYSL